MPNTDQHKPQRNFILALTPFFRPYTRQIWTWYLVYGIYFLMGILTPLSVRYYLDDALPSGSMKQIMFFVGFYMVYVLVLHYFYYIGWQGTQRLVENVVADMRLAVYQKLHRLSIRYFDKSLSGELVNQVTNDTRQILTLVGGELVNTSLQICMGAVSLVILLVWNQTIGLVVLVFIPIYILLFRRFLPLVHKAARAWRRGEDRLWGNWGEKLKGVNIIQAFVREKSESLKHHQFGHTAADRWYRMAMFGVQMNVLAGVTNGFLNHTAYALGCLVMVNGGLKIGELLTLTSFIGFIINPIQSVFNLVNTWQQSKASAERIQRIMEEVEEVRATEGRIRVQKLRGEIRFEHVAFEYEKDRPVLHDITLSVAAGKSVALVGHTGCGKSTMVHLLQGFYRPKSGTILIDGIPTPDMNPQDLRRNIGTVSQDVVLLNDSVRANVIYGNQDATDEEIWNVLSVAQITDYVKKLPKGLDTMIGGENGVLPSEGESQRLSMARALLKDPGIMVLDEATSSLDSNEEARLQEATKGLLKDRTAIIIAHRLSTIRNCDLVVVLEGGRILETGDPRVLVNQENSVYAKLHRDHTAAGVIRA